MVWSGWVRHGWASQGVAGKARPVTAGRDMAGLGRHVEAWPGGASRGGALAWHGFFHQTEDAWRHTYGQRHVG
jgi:hypothetical protein